MKPEYVSMAGSVVLPLLFLLFAHQEKRKQDKNISRPIMPLIIDKGMQSSHFPPFPLPPSSSLPGPPERLPALNKLPVGRTGVWEGITVKNNRWREQKCVEGNNSEGNNWWREQQMKGKNNSEREQQMKGRKNSEGNNRWRKQQWKKTRLRRTSVRTTLASGRTKTITGGKRKNA